MDVHFWPHGNGTHTETMGHLTADLVPLATQTLPTLMPATFLRLALVSASGHLGRTPAPA